MSTIQERLMAQLPAELIKLLDSLTGNELNELQKINPRLIAKVYQAGAEFTINGALKLADEDKEEK